jgi:hypothetical protein
MPANALELLQKILCLPNKQIEVIIPSQTLSMQNQGATDQLLDILAGLTNLTGLELCKWSSGDNNLVLQKISALTTLQTLSIPRDTIDPSLLYNLTKLKVHTAVGDWRSLTRLEDLTVHSSSPTFLETFLTSLSTLTRLHVMLDNTRYQHFDVILTTLDNLKDFKISAMEFAFEELEIRLKASCTALESLLIGDYINDLDLDWISSNTRLTHFNVRHRLQQHLPLTKLRNITSTELINASQVQLFKYLDLTKLEIHSIAEVSVSDIAQQYTALESLAITSNANSVDALMSLTRLTRLKAYCSPPSMVPTNLRYLLAACNVKNLTALTRLEWLVLARPVLMESFDVKFPYLTKLILNFSKEQQANATLSTLSNLFSLRDLRFNMAEHYKDIYGVHKPFNWNLDSLTTLTNLEALDIKIMDINTQLLDTFSSVLTRLTELSVACPNSTGEILLQFTNLRALVFDSRTTVKNLRSALDEKLPRLVRCTINSAPPVSLLL